MSDFKQALEQYGTDGQISFRYIPSEVTELLEAGVCKNGPDGLR
jgi:hypothetical protein